MTPLRISALLLVLAPLGPAQTVKVVDDRGAPITSAVVLPDPYPIEDTSSGVEQPDPVIRGWTQTDLGSWTAEESPDGLFECRLRRPSRDPVAYVTRDGVIHTGHVDPASYGPEPVEPITVVVPRPGTVQVRVFGPDGLPAAGARVAAGYAKNLRQELLPESPFPATFFFDDGAFAHRDPSPWVEAFTADDLGVVTVTGLRPGWVTLCASTDDAVIPRTRSVDVRPGTTELVTLNLVPASWLEVRVEPTRLAALSRPRVLTSQLRDEGYPCAAAAIGKEVDDTTVRLGPLPPGDHVLRYPTREALSVRTCSASLMPGETRAPDINYLQLTGPVVRGHVAPELLESLESSSLSMEISPGISVGLRTDDAGAFEIRLLEPGPVVLRLNGTVAVEGGWTTYRTVAETLVEVGALGRDDIQLRREKGSITIQLPLLEEGRHAGARILFPPPTGFAALRRGDRSPDGKITWTGLAPGPYVVELYRGGWLEPERSLGTFTYNVPKPRPAAPR